MRDQSPIIGSDACQYDILPQVQVQVPTLAYIPVQYIIMFLLFQRYDYNNRCTEIMSSPYIVMLFPYIVMLFPYIVMF